MSKTDTIAKERSEAKAAILKTKSNIEKLILERRRLMTNSKDLTERSGLKTELQILEETIAMLEADLKTLDETRFLRAFLCHSSSDKVAVRRLYTQLRTAKWIDPWLDEEELLPGENWDLEIRKAVKSSDIVIVCLSRSSVNKEGYLQKEIKHALDIADEKPEGTIYVVPLKLDACDVPDRLSTWQWVNYFEEGGYDRLMKSLQKRATTLGIMVE
jgi:hypothetical protein